jgi:hypothetical protein
MNFEINSKTGNVVVDGILRNISLQGILDVDIDFVEWFDSTGLIIYKKTDAGRARAPATGQEEITDMTQFQPVLNKWTAAAPGPPPPLPNQVDTELTPEDIERLLIGLGVTRTQINNAKRARGT